MHACMVWCISFKFIIALISFCLALSELQTTGTCTCPGYNVTYSCTVVGGEATLWRGTAFDSDCEITLNHSRFSDIGGTSGTCNDGSIVGYSIEQTNGCYTSQLTVSVTSNSINRTIECAVVNNTTSAFPVDTEAITPTTGNQKMV